MFLNIQKREQTWRLMLIHCLEGFAICEKYQKNWPLLLCEFGKLVSVVEEAVHIELSVTEWNKQQHAKLCMLFSCVSEFLLILEWQPDWSLRVFERRLSTGHIMCLRATWY